MPRYRRRSYRRKPQNLRWNPYFSEDLTNGSAIPQTAFDGFHTLNAYIPRIGLTQSGEAVNRPINDNTIERMRGEIFVENDTNKDVAMAFTGAVFPHEYAEEIVGDPTMHPTISENADFDDYLMFQPIACVNTNQIITRDVDNKSKRKLPVGDVLVLACHILMLGTKSTITGKVICATFGRILSKLNL